VASLVHEAWAGWWVVAAVRGDRYVAPVRPIHRPHHGDFAIGPSLSDVATWAYGFDTRQKALDVARDLFPYEGLRAAA
jgi:hypothetical protein